LEEFSETYGAWLSNLHRIHETPYIDSPRLRTLL
jgi:hypothetical protein